MRADTPGTGEEHGPGSACWIDLGAADMAWAAAFYEDPVRMGRRAPDDIGYRLREIASASPRLIGLRTDDLTAALGRATRSGATIIDAEYGLLRDPARAAFRLVAHVP
jgi:hypothetical protein